MKSMAVLTVTMLLSGCLLESVRPVDRNIKPYGAHWVKVGMTKENRLDDTVACGSGRTEYVLFSDEEIARAKHPEDANDIWAGARLTKQWAACMRSKGYMHLEQCDERCQYP